METVLDRLIVKIIEKKEPESKIIKIVEGQETIDKKPLFGEVQAFGPGRANDPMNKNIKVGSKIYFPRFSGHDVTDKNIEYKAILQQDILLIQ